MGWEMGLDPKAVASLTIKGIVAAAMLHNNGNLEQIGTIYTGIDCLLGCVSLSNEDDLDSALKKLTDELPNCIDSTDFELPEYCKSLLCKEFCDPDVILQILCEQDPRMELTRKIKEICRKDAQCSLETLPLDEIVSSILNQCEAEIKQNKKMETYVQTRRMYKKEFPSMYCANVSYVDSFIEPLFLHDENLDSPVNLTNLFVMPKYKRLQGYEENSDRDVKNDLQGDLKDFLWKDDNTRFLFIEGDAGCGKTTLAAWMNYHYVKQDATGIDIFAGRKLLTIRLRDLDLEIIRQQKNLPKALLEYMNVPSARSLNSQYPGAVLLLDGFDELCMIEGFAHGQDCLLQNLVQPEWKKFKFIITTRPKYVSYSVKMPCKFLMLEHFDAEKRNEWLEKYITASEKEDDRAIAPSIEEYIRGISDDNISCICDTPMTLYMLAAKKEAAQYLENNWALYNYIFSEPLSETEYNCMIPTDDGVSLHPIWELRDALYRISEEIAYEMYKTGNSKFYLSDSQLKEIIEKLENESGLEMLEDDGMQRITQHCYALCCYWKANSDSGAVEFLHNTIRDFFLAEKICREMDKLGEEVNNSKDFKKITNKLCSMLSYAQLEPAVLYFIAKRTQYKKESSQSNFAQYEYENHWVTSILQDMSENGVFRWNACAEDSPWNPVQRIQNIVKCTVQIYQIAYDSYLPKNERIPWVSKKNPENNILSSLLDGIVTGKNEFNGLEIGVGRKGDFSEIYLVERNLMCCNFSEANFSDSVMVCSDGTTSNFSHANFHHAGLMGCNFRAACFSGANLSSTDLSNVDFSGADLSGADLSNADVSHADLSDTNLSNANLSNANLSNTDLSGADLSNADLSNADLGGANLCNTDLRTAHFNNTRILDSICNINSEE